jgi:hypothetical protein
MLLGVYVTWDITGGLRIEVSLISVTAHLKVRFEDAERAEANTS